MAKIALVGCGWLGLPLAISLIEKGNFVVGTTTSSDKLEQLLISGIEAYVWSGSDMENETSLPFLENIDTLILNIPPGKNTSNLSYSSVLEKLCSYIPEKTNVLLISTTSIYPDSIDLADEEYVWSDEDRSKETVQAEIKLTQVLNERLTVLRLAGLLGKDRHPIKHLSGKENLSNGLSPVNLIHLNDVIGLIEMILNKKYWGKILNGCHPSHPTRMEYYTNAANRFNLQVPHFENNATILKVVSSKKSMMDLGYTYSTEI